MVMEASKKRIEIREKEQMAEVESFLGDPLVRKGMQIFFTEKAKNELITETIAEYLRTGNLCEEEDLHIPQKQYNKEVEASGHSNAKVVPQYVERLQARGIESLEQGIKEKLTGQAVVAALLASVVYGTILEPPEFSHEVFEVIFGILQSTCFALYLIDILLISQIIVTLSENMNVPNDWVFYLNTWPEYTNYPNKILILAVILHLAAIQIATLDLWQKAVFIVSTCVLVIGLLTWAFHYNRQNKLMGDRSARRMKMKILSVY